jgi:hypothetical protein
MRMRDDFFASDDVFALLRSVSGDRLFACNESRMAEYIFIKLFVDVEAN